MNNVNNDKRDQTKSKHVEEMKKKLGKELKMARKAAGFTQGNVAENLNINSKTLSSYETGRSLPSIDFLVDAATLYGMEAAAFFGFAQTCAVPAKNLFKIPVLSASKHYKNRSEFFMANDPLRFEYADVERPDEYVFICAPDDSMSDFRILKNDIVLLRNAQAPKDGDIVAALVGGLPVIRKYERLTESRYLLKPGDVSGSAALVVENDEADHQKVELLGVMRLVVTY